MNLHPLARTSTSSWRVCQFRHPGNTRKLGVRGHSSRRIRAKPHFRGRAHYIFPMTYDEAIAFWFGSINYEVRSATPEDLKLERMRAFLRGLGDPHHRLRIVHITGTKGKGSTAAMLGAMSPKNARNLFSILSGLLTGTPATKIQKGSSSSFASRPEACEISK